MIEDNIFYNYVYLDPRKPGNYNYGKFHFNYEPFLIGKGKYNRLFDHLRETEETTYNPYKVRKINKIKNEGLNPIILKIFEGLNEVVSFENEVELIATIGRRDKGLGPLTNLNDGGKGGETYSRPVYQYSDPDIIFIKEFKSVKEASYAVKSSHIGSCCKNNNRTAKGYFWSYYKYTEEEIINKRNDRIKDIKYKYICKFDKNNLLLNTYISAKDASISTNISKCNISLCLNGKLKTAGGFIWKYNEN